MTVKDLKQKLIHRIGLSENRELLEEMYRLIANEESNGSLYELSEEQIGAVEEAQLQYREGKFLTSNQADKEVDEWLEE
jgi:hypothetical protein